MEDRVKLSKVNYIHQFCFVFFSEAHVNYRPFCGPSPNAYFYYYFCLVMMRIMDILLHYSNIHPNQQDRPNWEVIERVS